MDSWARTTQPLNDISMADMYASGYSKPGEAWETMSPYNQQPNKAPDGNGQKSARHVVVTLKDDQLGQLVRMNSHETPPLVSSYDERGMGKIGSFFSSMVCLADTVTQIEALSPPKKGTQTSNSQNHPPLPARMTSLFTRPSAAALARKASYRDATKTEKENRPSARMAAAYPYLNREAQSQMQNVGGFDSDVSIRDLSSVFSMAAPVAEHRSSPAHVSSAGGTIKSRKEGQAAVYETRHDQSLFPEFDSKDAKVPSDARDVGAGTNPDQEFTPCHKAMSSVDSTARFERQLYSALGEELSGFQDDVMDPAETMSVPVPAMEDFDTSASKRKRQGTFGDRDRSPMMKMIRDGQPQGEIDIRGSGGE